MKRWYSQLIAFMLVGAFLASITYDLIRGLRSLGHSKILESLSLSGAGLGLSLGATLVLIFIFCFDAIWVLMFVVWLIKKAFHIKSKDNALYLP